MSVKSKISQSKMELEVDIESMFGVPVENESLRQQIGQALIDKITERTGNAQRLGGGSFKGYSTEYKNSLAYKVGRKSGDVNLKLTGDMLETLDIKNDTDSMIKLGWESSTQNAKAFNHHTGDTLPKRPFFGLQKNELDAVASEFQSRVDLKSRLSKAKENFQETAVNEIKRILLGQEDEDV